MGIYQKIEEKRKGKAIMRVSWWFLSGGENPFFGVFDLLLGLSLFLCCAPLLKLKCEGLLPQSTPSTCGKLLSACHEIILFMHPTAALLHRPLVRAAHQHHHVAAAYQPLSDDISIEEREIKQKKDQP